MLGADAVVCICAELKREIAERGVPEDRIFITPNAVDITEFQVSKTPPADSLPAEVQQTAAKLSGCVLGYVGSLRKLEGVDELVRGVAQLHRRGQDVSLLVVGGGPDLPKLKKLAEKLGLADRAVFTNRVEHDLVSHYYRLIDVFVISRPDVRVTRIVTPLKPLEAMALKRALVMSDLPALRELGEEGETALYYAPGDVGDLAEVCQRLIDDPQLRECLGEKARQWVCEHRTWSASLKSLPAAYECARLVSAEQR